MKKQGQEGFFIEGWRASPSEGLLVRDNITVHLEPKAMEVLVYLASKPGVVITREELEREVWRGALVGYDAVTSTVIKLRKALQDNARQPRFIATIPKKGYQLIAPIRYAVEDGAGSVSRLASKLETDTQQRQQPRGVHKNRLIISVVASLAVLVLVWILPFAPSPDRENKDASPSIAVLPFENLSNDPKQEYLADGITEDLITDLSRLSSLLVISSSASSLYKGKQVQAQDIGNDLKVDFVLKGNIRRVGGDIRINTQLIDTRTGYNKWAGRYDRKVGEVFAVQDEVARSIVTALKVQITRNEKQQLARRSTGNLKAYDFFQEGQRYSKVQTRESNILAMDAYKKAIEADPEYGRAYGAMAFSLALAFRRGWTDAPREALERALDLAKKGVALDVSIPQTHWSLGYVYLMRRELDKAEKAVSKAIRIAPSYADGYGLLALISNNLGKPEKAVEYVKKGMRLNPYYTWDYLFNLGHAYYTMGHYNDAIEALVKAQERNANAIPIRLFLAASYVKAGRLEDAEWETDQIQMLNPAETISHTNKTTPIVNSKLKKEFLEDLRKAGLPE